LSLNKRTCDKLFEKIMMTSDHYLKALEQKMGHDKKMGHKEAITRERKLERRYDYVEIGARC
jgi:hypothetical protein